MRDDILSFYKGKTVCITGAVGSVGTELVRQLLSLDVKMIRAVDQNESELFYAEQRYSEDSRFFPYQADIKNTDELERIFSDVDYVFHTAALKHVPSCERSPFSAVENNIQGIISVIKAAQSQNVKNVLFTSSDKAVNPTNVMGGTKLLGERLLVAANNTFSSNHTKFSITRFGNIAGSRGSVIPLFCEQIKAGKNITLTSEKMTRFMMSMNDAVKLVLESMVYSQGGETFITKMPTIGIYDLTKVLIDMVAPYYGKKSQDIQITITGPRPGEKMWEELSSSEESRRLLEGEKYLCVLPCTAIITDELISGYFPILNAQASHIYASNTEKCLSKEEIRHFLLKGKILPEEIINHLTEKRG